MRGRAGALPRVVPGAMGEGSGQNRTTNFVEKADRLAHFVQARTVQNELFQNTNNTAGQCTYFGALAV